MPTNKYLFHRNGNEMPLACVAGDIDLVRPLGLAGIPCAVIARPGAMTRYSKFTKAILKWNDAWEHPAKVVDTLIEFASSQKLKPLLFYEHDAHLLLISKFRQRLSEAFRFVLPDPELVEGLTDKLRFYELAKSTGLPVPKTRVLFSESGWHEMDLDFPIVVKPQKRIPKYWSRIGDSAKAVKFAREEDLLSFREAATPENTDLLAQELIVGPESSIESYHVYVDEGGAIAGEFTGKKIRTYPQTFGHSCSLAISDASDVAETGREVVQKLRFRGVAKLDFKRAPDGRLFLLEINPRFNLWHHLGAVAGVNLPALVYADLAGLPRPPMSPLRPGVRWCRVWQDLRASRADRVPLGAWVRWAAGCEIKRGLTWDDPLPIIAGGVWRGASNLSQLFSGSVRTENQTYES